MPSNSNSLLRSIRRWLLISVFLLGIGVIMLADIAYIVSNYESGGIPAAVGITGGVIALITGGKVLGSFSAEE